MVVGGQDEQLSGQDEVSPGKHVEGKALRQQHEDAGMQKDEQPPGQPIAQPDLALLPDQGKRDPQQDAVRDKLRKPIEVEIHQTRSLRMPCRQA
ncbi:hypothetical protein BI347_22030 [Chromobacterium sphagni]|uniref:Uncharacterized protein n=1 Tax=Chromobacterium sphagni TaxID=1903179 RepID=A0A1S1WT46_9NEIS|nr:hypothetical protein BI347_22030 [Chromobacterium sphagni]